MDFKELICERRSVRSYEVTRIDPVEMKEIVRDAMMAPSWKNNEEARYYAALSEEMIAKVKDTLPPYNQKNSDGASYVLSTFVKGLSAFNNGVPVDQHGDMWGAYDAGLANAYFVLSAKQHGYDTLIMGLRDEAKLREIFCVPEEEEILSLIAVGKRKGDAFFNPRKSVDDVLKNY